jgi:hypothetical protein
MPVFKAAAPQTRAQKRRRWIAAAMILAAGSGFAVWVAIDCAHIVFGYIASYSFAIVFRLGYVVALIGLPLLIYWRTRSTGIALIGTGIAMYLVFLGCIGILKRFDKVAWMHEPPAQRIGPDQKESLIIYYRPGTTGRQIEDFVEHKLEGYPSKAHNGTGFPDFVTQYWSLDRSQANGFDASALNFEPGADEVAVSSFIGMVQCDPRVARVFRDVPLSAIHVPKVERVPPSSTHKNR